MQRPHFFLSRWRVSCRLHDLSFPYTLCVFPADGDSLPHNGARIVTRRSIQVLSVVPIMSFRAEEAPAQTQTVCVVVS